MNNSQITRYDYKTKSLLLLIEKENLNNNFKWVELEIFQKYLEIITNKKYNEID